MFLLGGTPFQISVWGGDPSTPVDGAPSLLTLKVPLTIDTASVFQIFQNNLFICLPVKCERSRLVQFAEVPSGQFFHQIPQTRRIALRLRTSSDQNGKLPRVVPKEERNCQQLIGDVICQRKEWIVKSIAKAEQCDKGRWTTRGYKFLKNDQIEK